MENNAQLQNNGTRYQGYYIHNGYGIKFTYQLTNDGKMVNEKEVNKVKIKATV